jgi:hypothetical protein
MIRKLGIAATLALAILVGVLVPHALATSTSWWGLQAPASTTVSGSCRNSGPQYVWIAVTGTQSLDIIQLGVIGQTYFYAYGSGTPNTPGSNYTEVHLGAAGTGYHYYSISYTAPIWTLKIDSVIVASINNSFRNWTQKALQTMAEGTVFGSSRCHVAGTNWQNKGSGSPEPPTYTWGIDWWQI